MTPLRIHEKFLVVVLFACLVLMVIWSGGWIEGWLHLPQTAFEERIFSADCGLPLLIGLVVGALGTRDDDAYVYPACALGGIIYGFVKWRQRYDLEHDTPIQLLFPVLWYVLGGILIARTIFIAHRQYTNLA